MAALWEKNAVFFIRHHFHFPYLLFHSLWKTWKTPFFCLISRHACRKVLSFWGRKRAFQTRNGMFSFCHLRQRRHRLWKFPESLWLFHGFSKGLFGMLQGLKPLFHGFLTPYYYY